MDFYFWQQPAELCEKQRWEKPIIPGQQISIQKDTTYKLKSQFSFSSLLQQNATK